VGKTLPPFNLKKEMCILTTGFTLDCKTQSAGIKSIYLVEFGAKATLTKSSGEVSAHTLTSPKVYFKYELEKETTAMTWRTIPSTENGTVFYEAEVNARLHKVTTAQRNEIKLLAQNRMLLIVLDAEGNYWLLGADYGVQLQQSESNFGQAFGDFKGHVLNFLHKETDLPLKVQSAVVTSLGLS
jgi:hypothetical protein